jgi:hypothetical protein
MVPKGVVPKTPLPFVLDPSSSVRASSPKNLEFIEIDQGNLNLTKETSSTSRCCNEMSPSG